MRRLVVATLLLLALGIPSVWAQTPAGLIGAWERTSLLDGDGYLRQPPAAAALLIIDASGWYMQVAIPTGRPKAGKPLDQMSKEELLARFDRLEARRGQYAVEGNRLTRRYAESVDPGQEGTEQVQLFRIDGDTLILSSTNPNLKNEARFRRMK